MPHLQVDLLAVKFAELFLKGLVHVFKLLRDEFGANYLQEVEVGRVVRYQTFLSADYHIVRLLVVAKFETSHGLTNQTVMDGWTV